MSLKNKSYNNNSIIIMFVLFSLIFFYGILFYVFSQILVDTLIGICLLVLFFSFYFFMKESIYNYFLNQWNSMLIYFFNLLFLISFLKLYIINLNYIYLSFLKYKLNTLYVSLSNFNFIDVKVNLINLFNINFFNLKILNKLIIIDKFNKYLLSLKITFNDNINIDYHKNTLKFLIING